MPGRRRRRGCCRTGTTQSCRICAADCDVLIAAHGNSLRALIKHLDGLSDEAVVALNVPTGIPLHYDLDPRDACMPTKPAEYLDPEAAAAVDPSGGQPGQEVAARPVSIFSC